MRYLFLYSIVNENVNLFYDCSTEKFVTISSMDKNQKNNVLIYTGLVILVTSFLRLFNTRNENYSPILFYVFPLMILIGYFIQNKNFQKKYYDLVKGEKKEYNQSSKKIYDELIRRRKTEIGLIVLLSILYFILVKIYFLTSNLALLLIINLLSLFIGMIFSGLNYVKKNEKRINSN